MAKPLPHWNGYPARLILPGWTATYWVKHITLIRAVSQRFDGFWMKSAYRIPQDKFPISSRFLSQDTAANTPITEMVVNSLIVTPTEGANGRTLDRDVVVNGIAWDGGHGITSVSVSIDARQDIRAGARLVKISGRYSFRPWSYSASGRKEAGPSPSWCMRHQYDRTGTDRPDHSESGRLSS